MENSRRIAVRVEYAGGKFCGSQLQSGDRTVQLELERALNLFFRTGEERAIKVNFSGRTDSGVHALGQVAHFDIADDYLRRFCHSGSEGLFGARHTKSRRATCTASDASGLAEVAALLRSDTGAEANCASSGKMTANIASNQSGIKEALFPTADLSGRLHCTDTTDSLTKLLDPTALKNLCWALNGILPDDLSIIRAQVVPHNFNARYSARRRTYVYRILNRAQRSALRNTTQYFLNSPLDVDAMKTACQCLLGRSDFAAFKSSNKEKVSTICLVERAEILNKGEGELEFWICADHFVYNMVRIIVGTLLEVGLGKRAPSALSEALAGKDRHLAGPTAPPWGLCLYSVDYPAEFSLFQKDSQDESW